MPRQLCYIETLCSIICTPIPPTLAYQIFTSVCTNIGHFNTTMYVEWELGSPL